MHNNKNIQELFHQNKDEPARFRPVTGDIHRG